MFRYKCKLYSPYPPFVAFLKAPARSGTQKKSRPQDTRGSPILKNFPFRFVAKPPKQEWLQSESKMAGGSLWRVTLGNIAEKRFAWIKAVCSRCFSAGNQLRNDKDVPVDQKLLDILVCPLSKKPLR